MRTQAPVEPNVEPSIVYKNGTKVWATGGLVGRNNGPAVITADGREHHYQHGLRHRRHGPAIESADGGLWFWHGHPCPPLAEPTQRNDGTWIWPDGRPVLYDPGLVR